MGDHVHEWVRFGNDGPLTCQECLESPERLGLTETEAMEATKATERPVT